MADLHFARRHHARAVGPDSGATSIPHERALHLHPLSATGIPSVMQMMKRDLASTASEDWRSSAGPAAAR